MCKHRLGFSKAADAQLEFQPNSSIYDEAHFTREDKWRETFKLKQSSCAAVSVSCSWIPVEVSNIYERKPQQVGNMINLCFCTYLLLLVHEFPNKTMITKGLLVYEYCTSLMIKSNSGDSSNPCTFKFYLHKAVNLQDLQLEHFLWWTSK